MGQLNLETHSDSIVPLLTGDVKDEPAEETQKHTNKIRSETDLWY